MTKKDQAQTRPRRKGLKANYGDATPEDVARALLLYRPKRKQKPSTEDTDTDKPEPATD